MPTKRSFVSAFRSTRTEGPKALLFPDTFTNRFEPAIGHDAVAVLEHLGQRVEVPRATVCCGLTLLSTGQLGLARRVLRRTARILRPWTEAGVPVVGLEPSCTAFLRSDARALAGDDPDVARLADSVRTFAEHVAPDLEALPTKQKAIVQTHCHQYAELGFDADRAMLAKAGVAAEVLDSGCCGLAGNFGFERGHHEVSMACAEQVLLPAVRAADSDTEVIADGFSCRTQVRQGADRDPIHSATAVARALGLRQDSGSGPI